MVVEGGGGTHQLRRNQQQTPTTNLVGPHCPPVALGPGSPFPAAVACLFAVPPSVLRAVWVEEDGVVEAGGADAPNEVGVVSVIVWC